MERLGYRVGSRDWVFPSRTRTLKQTSSLVNAIKSSRKEAGVDARVTPHVMRYANVDPVVRRALVGHVTEEMQEHYSIPLVGSLAQVHRHSRQEPQVVPLRSVPIVRG